MQNLTISGIFPAEYLLILQERGTNLRHCLNELKLSSYLDQLRQQDIPFEIMCRMMQHIWEQSQQDVTIGMQAGLRISLSAFGSFGQAVLSSEDLKTALNFILEFWPLIGRGIEVQWVETGDHVVLRFKHALYCEQYLKDWMIESAVFSFWRALSTVFPVRKQDIRVCLNTAEKPLPDHISSDTLKFNTGINSIEFPKELLNLQIPFQSLSSYHAAKAQCAIQLKRIQSTATMTAKVHGILGYQQQGYPSLETAASILATSPRTLRRYLEHEGTKYSVLMQQIKTEDACFLLSTAHMRIEKIAELLGYEDEANFCRAFKRWTGMTPSNFRNQDHSAGF